MASPLSVDRLHHVGIVVRDIDLATKRYAEIFGINEWYIRDLGPAEITNATVGGRRVEAPRLRIATATSVPPDDCGWDGTENLNRPVSFELVQPVSGESVFMDFRFKRRQGISHLKLGQVNSDDFVQVRARAAALGIEVAASMTVDGRIQRYFLDTRKALGGYYVELDVEPESSGPGPVGCRVDHRGSYSRPEGTGPLQIFGINHFGIVVDDVMETIQNYRDVFGLNTWEIREWRTEKGSLERPFYRNKQVDHAYLTALAIPFLDFGLEIIQPTHGPSHYNREFRDLWGAGIHHMLLNVSSGPVEWERTRAWLDSIDVPMVMGGGLMEGAAEFGYYDTTEALGGYILEAFVLKSHPTQPRDGSSTDFAIDFAALAEQL
ncbi:hypothetical protein JCM18899A_54850 [Nocardioides sp. AN3]